MRTAIILCLLAASLPAWAADSNQSVSVQGVLRDGAGQLQSMPIDLDVRLYATSTDATPFYSQHFAAVAIDNGFFSVEVGDGSLALGGHPEAWIGVLVAGDDAELPRQHLAAAPYSLSANQCSSADDSAALGGKPAASWQQKLSKPSCPPGQAYTAIAPDGTATCAGQGGWVKIYDQLYNANGVQTIPVMPSGGTTTLRILFSGVVTPFSGPSEILARPSAATGAYNVFVISESVSAAGFNTGATQPGFIMGRTVDTGVSTMAFDFLLTETAGTGAIGFGQGSLIDSGANQLLRANGNTSYTGTSSSLSIAFWNTTKVNGRFTVLQLM